MIVNEWSLKYRFSVSGNNIKFVINIRFILEIMEVIIKTEFCGIQRRLYGRKVTIKLFWNFHRLLNYLNQFFETATETNGIEVIKNIAVFEFCLTIDTKSSYGRKPLIIIYL